MKVKSVRVVYPDDPKILNTQYTKAVAKIISRRIPYEFLNEFIEKLNKIED